MRQDRPLLALAAGIEYLESGADSGSWLHSSMHLAAVSISAAKSSGHALARIVQYESQLPVLTSLVVISAVPAQWPSPVGPECEQCVSAASGSVALKLW